MQLAVPWGPPSQQETIRSAQPAWYSLDLTGCSCLVDQLKNEVSWQAGPGWKIELKESGGDRALRSLLTPWRRWCAWVPVWVHRLVHRNPKKSCWHCRKDGHLRTILPYDRALGGRLFIIRDISDNEV